MHIPFLISAGGVKISCASNTMDDKGSKPIGEYAMIEMTILLAKVPGHFPSA